jgi:hypothetical protein
MHGNDAAAIDCFFCFSSRYHRYILADFFSVETRGMNEKERRKESPAITEGMTLIPSISYKRMAHSPPHGSSFRMIWAGYAISPKKKTSK